MSSTGKPRRYLTPHAGVIDGCQHVRAEQLIAAALEQRLGPGRIFCLSKIKTYGKDTDTGTGHAEVGDRIQREERERSWGQR